MHFYWKSETNFSKNLRNGSGTVWGSTGYWMEKWNTKEKRERRMMVS